MRRLLSLFVLLTAALVAEPADAPKLKLLFLGDSAGHQPKARFAQLQPVFAARGIDLTYTDKLDDLNAKTLSGYDGLMIYANHTKIAPEQEKALLDYVASGKGFIPIHCASYCFLNSPAYTDLVGAQFRSHGTGTFRTTVVKADHPITTGYSPFSSWDETYVHTKHNEKDRTVLEVRTDGDLKEPWTWVRTPGKSRVFYTAWGHDARTWGHEGFQNLLERGVRWACGQDPALAGSVFEKPHMTAQRKDVKPFEYAPAKIPFYAPKKGAGITNVPPDSMQKPLPMDESIKHFVTPVDFEVKTFVTEEKLGGKPIAMTWDERGRLWLSLTTDYPNDRQPEGEGRDRIVVCEDTDGDGVCDKVTEFADKLSIPTSLLPYAGGLIVHQAPHTLFLKDTDGDGKADVRQVLFTGWATNDTHAGPSNLHYGFDNWIYGAVGYAGYTGTVNGERLNFKQGFYRFKVEAGDALKVSKLEFLRSTSNNTWGLCFDEAGQLFGSTANGCPIVHMPIPNRYYEKVKGLASTTLQNIAPDYHIEPTTEKVRQVDWHGGFTAASNIAVYTARTYPREYWNRTAFISEPTGHLTATMTLHPSGSDYRARYGWNILASDDEWSAPIDAQVGPDGHMWVIDWYNFIVQHNPTPAGFRNGKGNAYETDLRDKKHGRIYRVVYTKAKAEAAFTLKDAMPEKLVEALKHHNMTWRLHAQRLLIDRGNKDMVPALAKLVEDKTVDETGLNAGAVHALWTIAALQAPENKFSGLTHPSAAVRQAAALTAAGEPGEIAKAFLAAGVLTDKEPKVALAALRRVAELPASVELGRLLAESAPQMTFGEKVLGDAFAAAVAPHSRGFLEQLAQSKTVPASLLPVAETVLKHHAATKDDAIVGLILKLKSATPEVQLLFLKTFAARPPAVEKLTPAQSQDFTALLGAATPAARSPLLKIGAAWGVAGLEAQLGEVMKASLATIADAKAPEADRIEAAKQVIEFQPDDDAAALKLLDAVTAQASPALAGGIFDALGASKSKALPAAVVAKLKDLPPAARAPALRLVLARPESAKAFLDGVEKGTLRFDMLALDQKTALASNPDKVVADRAKKLLAAGGGLPSPDRQKVIEDLKFVLAKTGDVANGKKIYTQHCAKCHKYAGEGENIGPDLTGMGTHPKEELLIHIIDPSRSVEGNYKAYRVVTTDGRVLIGLLASESKTSVEVIDAEAKRHPLSRDDIESLKETDKSLMPEGFEKDVKPNDLSDLLEFLTQKGKYVPLPLDKVATVVSSRDMFFGSGGLDGRMNFPDWKPKTFNGVPFVLTDPQGDKVKNVVMLNGPNGVTPPTMPKSVSLPFSGKAKAIHLLSGVGGWNAQAPRPNGPVSMIVRLTYEDGKTEDHELRDGVHFADYIGRFNVPGSQFAFALGGQQVRYLAVSPKRDAMLKTIELVKGTDRSSPVVMALTVESP